MKFYGEILRCLIFALFFSHLSARGYYSGIPLFQVILNDFPENLLCYCKFHADYVKLYRHSVEPQLDYKVLRQDVVLLEEYSSNGKLDIFARKCFVLYANFSTEYPIVYVVLTFLQRMIWKIQVFTWIPTLTNIAKVFSVREVLLKLWTLFSAPSNTFAQKFTGTLLLLDVVSLGKLYSNLLAIYKTRYRSNWKSSTALYLMQLLEKYFMDYSSLWFKIWSFCDVVSYSSTIVIIHDR